MSDIMCIDTEISVVSYSKKKTIIVCDTMWNEGFVLSSKLSKILAFKFLMAFIFSELKSYLYLKQLYFKRHLMYYSIYTVRNVLSF